MAKIKYTKTELKQQRDALRRFERYLPTLQLKKQQLQLEVRQLEADLEAKTREEEKAREDLRSWIDLFSAPVNFAEYLKVRSIEQSVNNIAGVNIPVLEGVDFDRSLPDLSRTAPWLDDALDLLEQLTRLRLERQLLEEGLRRLVQELRTTTQRVNLFEKVKIPETNENIRVIKIFLGDEQTAAVARAKTAKDRLRR